MIADREPSAVADDVAGALLIIEEALGSVDGTEDAAGDVWDFPNAFAALKIIASCISALTAERDNIAEACLERTLRAERAEIRANTAEAERATTREQCVSQVEIITSLNAKLAKAREAAFEECAKILDQEATNWSESATPVGDHGARMRNRARECRGYAAAIRALKAPREK